MMFLKLLATVTLIVPIIKGVKSIWDNKQSGIAEKIAETLTGIIPLIVGISDTWKKSK